MDSIFDRMLPYDQDLLGALYSTSLKPIRNFYELLRTLGMNKLTMETSSGKQLYRAIILKNTLTIRNFLNIASH